MGTRRSLTAAVAELSRRRIPHRMNRWLWRLIYVLAGLSFWIPGIIIHAIRRYHFGESHFDSLSILALPFLTSVVTLELLFRRPCGISSRGAIALWMLLGIWLFGTVCTTLGATFSGGGFAQPEGWQIIRWSLMGLFIPLTFMMSAYDGTLLSLIVVTIGFIITGIVSRRRPADEFSQTHIT